MSLRLSDALRLVPRTMSMQLVATILVAMAALQAVNLVILA